MDDKNFTTRWGFVLACVGSAVGMANVWGFPFRMGSYGGSAFLIPYIIFVVLFSYVGLSTEYAIGRMTGTGTLGSYEYVWKKRGFNKVAKVIGWIPLIGSFCIAIGYSVIVAYVLKALVESITGNLMHVDAGAWFAGFSSQPYSVVIYHIAIIVIVSLTLTVGAKSIEKTNKIMMPVFFILFIVLAIRVLLLDNSLAGYEFMFRPKFNELLNAEVWIFAMGQAFFSLSITGSGMIVYGSYLQKGEDIIKSSENTAFFDTIAALTSAIVVIPACFVYGVDLGSGPGLLFETLPTILQDIPFGRVFAIILFVAVVFGGISSLQNMIEVCVESILHKFPKLKRNHVLIVLMTSLFLISVNMHQISVWGPWMDLISIYIIPIGAIIGAASWFWVLDRDELLNEINDGAGKRYGKGWHSVGKYVYVPLALILCLIALFKGISF